MKHDSSLEFFIKHTKSKIKHEFINRVNYTLFNMHISKLKALKGKKIKLISTTLEI